MFGLEQITALVIQYKYAIAFPLLIVEGPVTSVVVGFLSSLGYFSILGALLVVFFGDMAGDVTYYFLGRFGRNKTVRRVREFFGMSDTRLSLLEEHFDEHGGKTVVIGKLAHGFGTIFCLGAGMARYSFSKFLMYSALVSLAKSAVLLATGYFFGRSYLVFGEQLEWVFYVLGAVIILAWLGILYGGFHKKKRNETKEYRK